MFSWTVFFCCTICGWFRSEAERTAGEWDGKLLGNQKGLTAEVITAKANNNNNVINQKNRKLFLGFIEDNSNSDVITAKANNNNSFPFRSPAILYTSDFWKDFWEKESFGPIVTLILFDEWVLRPTEIVSKWNEEIFWTVWLFAFWDKVWIANQAELPPRWNLHNELATASLPQPYLFKSMLHFGH